jgi:hypothetical protein
LVVPFGSGKGPRSLSEGGEEEGFFDVCGGFVVAGEEAGLLSKREGERVSDKERGEKETGGERDVRRSRACHRR